MMRLSDVNNILHLIALFLVLLLIERAVAIALRFHRFRRFAAENECLAGKKYKQTDVYLGLCLLFRIVRDYRAGGFCMSGRYSPQGLDKLQLLVASQTYNHYSWTEKRQGNSCSSFNDFGHGPSRRYALQPLVGDGVFATDGAKWAEARALLRPSFARSQMCDFEMLGNHYDIVKALPRDGDRVDLQDLSKRLTMDIIIDILFGASMGALTW